MFILVLGGGVLCLLVINYKYFYSLLVVINVGIIGVLIVIGNIVVVVGFGLIVKNIEVF